MYRKHFNQKSPTLKNFQNISIKSNFVMSEHGVPVRPVRLKLPTASPLLSRLEGRPAMPAGGGGGPGGVLLAEPPLLDALGAARGTVTAGAPSSAPRGPTPQGPPAGPAASAPAASATGPQRPALGKSPAAHYRRALVTTPALPAPMGALPPALSAAAREHAASAAAALLPTSSARSRADVERERCVARCSSSCRWALRNVIELQLPFVFCVGVVECAGLPAAAAWQCSSC